MRASLAESEELEDAGCGGSPICKFLICEDALALASASRFVSLEREDDGGLVQPVYCYSIYSEEFESSCEGQAKKVGGRICAFFQGQR